MIKDLEFVTPESEGLPSAAVLDLLDFFDEERINMHSFMLARHGKILAEAYYKPFDENFMHRLYSCSKSIVAMAVGRLVGEGLISLEDTLLSYFPEFSPSDPEQRRTTVEDALKMTLPFVGSHYSRLPGERGVGKLISDGWDSAYFSDRHPTVKLPGTIFDYHSHTSYILGLLVERVSGMTFLDYLRPIFDKIGVSRDIRCVNSPDGHPWGSSGVICTMRDFAKIGELLLNKGEYLGEQLLPRDYMERATSSLTDTLHDGGYSLSGRGYGYQIWTEAYGYGMHGLGGQFVFCFPDKDFMFVCNADTQDSVGNRMEMIYHCVSRLYKRLDTASESADEDRARLCERLKTLQVNRSFGAAHSPLEACFAGKEFALGKNPMGITRLSIEFSEDAGVLRYDTPRGERELPFGLGCYRDILFPEDHYYDMTIKRSGGRCPRALSTGSFLRENKLLINVDIIDNSLATLGIVIELSDNSISLKMTNTAEEFLAEYRGYAIGRWLAAGNIRKEKTQMDVYHSKPG